MKTRHLRTFALTALALALVAFLATGTVHAETVTQTDAATAQSVELETPTPETDLNLDVTASAEEMQQTCIQVITYGKNPGTGECKQFATPCDVPNGWEQFSTLEDCQAASS